MLEKIIESCYYVANNAKDVFINYDVLDNFILKVKCKRYTYNRIKRLLVHVLCQTEKNSDRNINYITMKN